MRSREVEWRIAYVLMRGLFYTKITLEGAHKQFATYIISFLRRHNDSMNDDKNEDHINPVSHPLGLRSADDVTIDCWWHHNDQIIMTRTREKYYLAR